MVVLKIFTGKNCPKCPAAKKLIEEVSGKYDNLEIKEIDIQEDQEEALMCQVTSTPSIAIGEETIFFGEVPSEDELEKEIKKALV